MEKKLHVGIIIGGRSGEREVSLNSGRNVFTILNRQKFEPHAIFWTETGAFYEITQALLVQNTTQDIADRLGEAIHIPYEKLKDTIDIAFLTTYGKFGEDGCLQGLLKILNIPCTSSGILGAALGMDKMMQRKIMKGNPKINLPDYEVLFHQNFKKNPEEQVRDIQKNIPFPWIIKPSREGSTLGVEFIEDEKSFLEKAPHAFSFDNEIIIEPYLEGLEFSCVVLGENPPRSLTPTETVHSEKIFTYHDKYMPGVANKITPARVSEKTLQEIKAMCEETFKILQMSVYARIDGFVQNEKILITDPNVFSGMSPSSWTFHQAAHEGWMPGDLIDKLIQLTLEKYEGEISTSYGGNR